MMSASRKVSWLKIVGLCGLGLIGVVAVVVGGAFAKYSVAAAKDRPTGPLTLKVPLPTDTAEGGRLARVKGCFDCHGENLAGKVFAEDPAIGLFAGSNLTTGRGGKTFGYRTEDWVRAIRYGVNREGKALRFMPSAEFAGLTDEDLAKLISYLSAAAPVDRDSIEIRVGPLAKILYAFGQLPLLFSADQIPPELETVESLKPENSVAYGKYLSAACTGCHGPTFAGGPIPGVPPSWPPAADLRPNGPMKTWSFEDFRKVLTEGITPEGRAIDPQFMPWKAYAAMTDTELRALYRFLKDSP